MGLCYGGNNINDSDDGNDNTKWNDWHLSIHSFIICGLFVVTVVEEEEAKSAASPEKAPETKTSPTQEKSDTKTTTSPEKTLEGISAGSPGNSSDAKSASNSEKSPITITQVSLLYDMVKF